MLVPSRHGREVDDTLLYSLKEEREMLLAHRARLQTALQQVIDIVDITVMRPGKNEALLTIRDIAEAALTL